MAVRSDWQPFLYLAVLRDYLDSSQCSLSTDVGCDSDCSCHDSHWHMALASDGFGGEGEKPYTIGGKMRLATWNLNGIRPLTRRGWTNS